MPSAKQGNCEYHFLVFLYDSTRGMNPRSTECEAGALTITPSLLAFLLCQQTKKFGKHWCRPCFKRAFTWSKYSLVTNHFLKTSSEANIEAPSQGTRLAGTGGLKTRNSHADNCNNLTTCYGKQIMFLFKRDACQSRGS